MGRDQLADLVPDLQAVITAMLPANARQAQSHRALVPQSIAIEVALDALIQLRAKTPATWARRLLSARPAQALILLSFAGPDADVMLREIAMHERDAPWFVAVKFLLSHRSSGTALTILTGLNPVGVLHVTGDNRVVAPARHY